MMRRDSARDYLMAGCSRHARKRSGELLPTLSPPARERMTEQVRALPWRGKRRQDRPGLVHSPRPLKGFGLELPPGLLYTLSRPYFLLGSGPT